MSFFAINKTSNRRTSPTIATAPSPILAHVTPWLTIAAGSMIPSWLMIASFPSLPPLGFILLLCWRQVRPGLLPVWAGFPLGALDDLFSGQPFGSAMVLWSVSMLVLEIVEHRFPWRVYITDWLIGGAMVIVYILATMLLARGTITAMPFLILQAYFSVMLYPAAGRLVAWFDVIRRTRLWAL